MRLQTYRFLWVLITLTAGTAGIAACATAATTNDSPCSSSCLTDPQTDASSSSSKDGPTTSQTDGGGGSSDAGVDAARVRKKIDGDPADLKDCDDLCSEHGLVCAPGRKELGGAGSLSVSWGIDGGQPCTQVGYCFTVPAPSDCWVDDRYDPVVAFSCYCH